MKKLFSSSSRVLLLLIKIAIPFMIIWLLFFKESKPNFKKAEELMDKGDYSLVIQIYEGFLTENSDLTKNEKEKYTAMLHCLYFQANNDKFNVKVLRDCCDGLVKMDTFYLSSFSIIAICDIKASNYRLAIKYIEKVVIYIEKQGLTKELPKLYLPNYAMLIFCYSKLQDDAKVNELEVRYTDISQKIYGSASKEYAESLDNLITVYRYLGNYERMMKLKLQVVELNEIIFGKESVKYASGLSELADINLSLGNQPQTIDLCTKAIKVFRNKNYTKTAEYANALAVFANYQLTMGNYPQALEASEEAKVIISKLDDKLADENYLNILNSIMACNISMGNYPQAIETGILLEKKLKNGNSNLGKDYLYSAVVNNLGGCYFYLKEYSRAVELASSAQTTIKQKFGEYSFQYLLCLKNLAYAHLYLGKQLKEAEKFQNKNKLPDSYEDKPIKNKGNEVVKLGTSEFNFKKAIYLMTQMVVIEKTGKITNPLAEAETQNVFTLYYSILGENSKAIESNGKTLDIYKNILGETNPQYIECLSLMAKLYADQNDLNKAATYYSESLSAQTEYICRNIGQMSENERTSYWKGNNQFFSELPRVCLEKGFDSRFTTLAYNCVLFAKGLLLNSSIELKKTLLESGNKNIVEKYYKLQQVQSTLNVLYEKSQNDQILNTDSLEREAENIERYLVTQSKDYGDFTRNFSMNWVDIQTQLHPNELAIEFVDFPVGIDSIMYVALLLRKGYSAPKMIPLFEEKELRKVIEMSRDSKRKFSNIYMGTSSASVYKLLWTPLEPFMKKGDKIYFAPSGLLHQLSIENLPFDKHGTPLKNVYDLFRVTSTKQIVTQTIKPKIKSAIIYGGIRYDIGEKNVGRKIKKLEEKNSPSTKENLFFRSTDNPTLGWAFLIGTEKEAKQVSELFTKNGIIHCLKLGEEATEESFKALSGKQTSLIHIATHGFFYSEKEAIKKDYFISKLVTGENNIRGGQIDLSLFRSGLLMAGGNRAWKGERIPLSIENGVLTAKEIANMDLRGTELIVLSACETGLGDVTGEGVFGLQRALKKAGVKTMILSLWRIQDDATAILMASFYSNLLKGMTKHEAFITAQDALRKTEKYNDPYYWAGFVMLD